MEDEIFNIVTDLLRDDINKTEAIDKLYGLYCDVSSFPSKDEVSSKLSKF